MGFLRRLLGGSEGARPGADDEAGLGDTERNEPDRSPDDEERAFELELLRDESARLDELRRRQLRYADYAWTPPPQGGERRAEDNDQSG